MFKFKLSLFWKFTFAIVFIVAIFGSINAYLIWQNVQGALERESENRVVFLAKDLSRQVIDPLLYEDYIGLQKILDETIQLDSTIKYIFLLDPHKKVLIRSFGKNISAALIKANLINGNDSVSIKLLQLSENPNNVVRDIAYPIYNSRLGTLRIGISENSIYADVEKTIGQFWLMVAFFLIIGVLGAFVFSYFITMPIRTIQNTADKLDFNSLEKLEIPEIIIRTKIFKKFPIIFRAKDEIDLLTEKFNDMINRLTIAYQELKNAESQLIQSEKLATIGTIFAGLAHEINNPILGIQNCLRRMSNDPQNIEQNKKYFGLMETASKRIESVIRNLLNYSRLENLKFEEVNINEQIENSLLMVAFKLENSRIIITRDRQYDYIPIYASKIHIEQITVNLLLNAIDAIDAAGENSARTIKISIAEEGKFVKLKIKDSGIGISENEVNKIFEPFFTTKAASKGTGLGLSIVYNIVNSHGGKIEVESEKNIGTVFIISLPKYKGV